MEDCSQSIFRPVSTPTRLRAEFSLIPQVLTLSLFKPCVRFPLDLPRQKINLAPFICYDRAGERVTSWRIWVSGSQPASFMAGVMNRSQISVSLRRFFSLLSIHGTLLNVQRCAAAYIGAANPAAVSSSSMVSRAFCSGPGDIRSRFDSRDDKCNSGNYLRPRVPCKN